jgi:polyisoprenoid-binding protein YceI
MTRATAAATALMVGAALGVPMVQAQLPTKFTNLQVLPKDIAPRELVDGMKGFTRALHVRCNHCHVYAGSDPDDLATYDFASDDKELKRSARALMQAAVRAGASFESVAPASTPASAAAAPRATAAKAPTPAGTIAKAADGYARFYQPLMEVDTAHSTIAFAVPFMGLSKTDGRFTGFSGAVWFDPADPQSAAITVIIDAKSLDTANKTRDEDLRSDQFFDVEKFPRLTFRSSRVEQRADTWLVTGPLTIHGVTQEVALPMRRIGAKLEDPWGNLRASFEGSLVIHRADFGIAGNGRFSSLADFAIGPDVDVTLRVQAVRYNVAKWGTDAKSVVPALLAIVEKQGAAAAVAEYRRLKKEEADKWIFPEGALSLLGHRLIQARRPADGLAMFELNAEVFPQSANVWDDLALARAVNGDLAGAREAAHRSQAIDAENPNVLELLRKLDAAAG